MDSERSPASLTGRVGPGHVVICNVNEKVRAIVEQLQNAPGEDAGDIVVIVQDDNLWESNPSWHPAKDGRGRVFYVPGCPAESEILRRASISRAKTAIILADPNHGSLADARSALIGISIERENPQVHTVMELILSVNRNSLRATAVDDVVCIGELSEKLLSQSAITPGVSKLFAYLLCTKTGSAQLFIRTIPNALEGRTYRDLARKAIQVTAPFVVCGFIRRTTPEGTHPCKRELVLNPRVNTEPGKDSALGTQDDLILLASRSPDLSLLV